MFDKNCSKNDDLFLSFLVPDIPGPYGEWEWGPRAVTSVDGYGAYLQNGDHLFELSCSTLECSWSLMSQKLQVGRRGTVLMTLPPSFECNQESIDINKD